MRSWIAASFVVLTAGCGPGLRSSFEDAGTPPTTAVDAGGDAGMVDAGEQGDAGADVDAGANVDGGDADAGSGCTGPAQCPAPPDGGVAVCQGGVCGFSCLPPLLPCEESCCAAIAVTAGDEHSCALTEKGRVKCWGYGIALGEFQDRVRPVDVPGLQSVVALSGGYNHTCALTSGGAMRCWGSAGNGVLGDGSGGLAPTPVTPVGLGSGVSAIATGAHHSCAVADGGLYCWGSNIFGQLGDNTNTARATPGPVSGMAAGVVEVAGGASHTCARVADGGLYCWGFNGPRQLGDGTTVQQQLTPVEAVAVTSIPDAGPATQLALGFSHSCARMASGAARCFGLNADGQTGDGSTSTPQRVSVEVAGLDGGVELVASGPTADHTCAIQQGALWCWGRNANGQLGDTTVVTPRRTPVRPFGLGPVRSVAAGASHTCAVTVEGGVKCWGLNDRGQLGDGTKTNRWSPVDVQW